MYTYITWTREPATRKQKHSDGGGQMIRTTGMSGKTNVFDDIELHSIISAVWTAAMRAKDTEPRYSMNLNKAHTILCAAANGVIERGTSQGFESK
jgi:hypothetical protein